jgi:hypothetical protein
VHALRHGCFGQALGLHFFFNLQCQYLFDGSGGGGFKGAFFFQEVIKFASNGHGVRLLLKSKRLWAGSSLSHSRTGGLIFE